MRKQLSLPQDEHGFYLPVVLVVTTLVLSFITMLIYTYQNQLQMTESMLHQIESETFIQMAVEDFTRMVHEEDPNEHGSISFEYPNGSVNIHYEQEKETKWILSCTIDFADRRLPLENKFIISVQSE